MMEAAWFLGVASIGALIGCGTGLFPGLHVNTLAVILLAASPVAFGGLIAMGVPPTLATWLVAALVLSISVSHTFVNILPATYLGAPDESTALSVLPAHKMLLRGHGYRAVRISAFASFWALAASLAGLVLVHWLLVGPPRLWDEIRAFTPIALVLLSAHLVTRERSAIGPPEWGPWFRRGAAVWCALALFLASGVYGLLAFRLTYHSWVPLPASPLLPMLGGMFGAATLLEALSQRNRVPHQFLKMTDDALTKRGASAALSVGVVAGFCMSLFPGLTNASATAVAGAARRSTDAEILVSLGAVNTSNAVFNLLALYAFDRARSGAVVAMQELVPVETWATAMPQTLAWFLFAALASAAVSLGATLWMGRALSRRVHRVPYQPMVLAVLVYVCLVALVFSGWWGLAVFGVGAALGMIPVRLGLQRTHLTGVLLVPILAYFWA